MIRAPGARAAPDPDQGQEHANDVITDADPVHLDNPAWPPSPQYASVLQQVPPLPPPPSDYRLPSGSANTTTTGVSSTQGGGRRRPKSPVKSLVDLPYAETPVYAQSLVDIQELLDDVARKLCKDLLDVALGRRVVPLRVRAHVDAKIKQLNPLVEAEIEDSNVMALARAEDGEGSEDGPGLALLMELNTICSIVVQTKHALDVGKNFAEVHWNERIHSSILAAALEPQMMESTVQDRKVAFYNVTVAKIAPGCIPAHVREDDLEGKMVDYCIVLCDRQVQHAAMTTLTALQSSSSQSSPSRPRIRSINQTEYAPVHLSPISVSIETKRSGGSEDQAQVQLSVWVMAQFRRIHQIRGTDRPGPVDITLPLLYVAGDEWRVLFAWEDAHGIVSHLLFFSTCLSVCLPVMLTILV